MTARGYVMSQAGRGRGGFSEKGRKTYILKRVFLGFWEEEVYRREDYQPIQSGEKSVGTPPDIREHWACCHDDLNISTEHDG